MQFINSKRIKEVHGFTLIELLIVVAIIAILAAIAIPNFLMAQIRAKIARVNSEQQSIATAMEAYYVDNNSYPFYQNFAGYDEVAVSHMVTTPISYLSTYPNDPFAVNNPYGLRNWIYEIAVAKDAFFFVPQQPVTFDCGEHQWLVNSYGPNLTFDSPFYNHYACTGYASDYNPTNGTISNGDINREGP